MSRQVKAERWLVLLLRVIGGVCLLALVPLWMPRGWIDAGHRWLGWGEFPAAPIAEYLARSVSALSAFYGGLLVALSFDVRRYIALIRYQAVAIMLLSACGAVVGRWAGVPWWLVGGDAAACWAYGVPMLVLARHVERTAVVQHDYFGQERVFDGREGRGPDQRLAADGGRHVPGEGGHADPGRSLGSSVGRKGHERQEDE